MNFKEEEKLVLSWYIKGHLTKFRCRIGGDSTVQLQHQYLYLPNIRDWTNVQRWVRSKETIKRTSKDEGSQQ